MTNKKLNGVEVWKQVEELAVPGLRLSVIDRAVYLYLLRKSRLEGKGQLRFSIDWLAQGARVSTGSARKSVRRLVDKGALRLRERSRAGHEAEVRLPEEIRGVRAGTVTVEGRRSVQLSRATLKRRISWKTGGCERRSTCARAGGAFIACGGLRGRCAASTT